MVLEAGDAVCWAPSPTELEQLNVSRLIRSAGLPGFRALLQKSQQEPEWFWDAVVGDLDIEFARPYSQVLDASRGLEWPVWFVDGQLNLAWNCVGKWAHRTPDAPAIVWEGEDGAVAGLTYRELWGQICRLAQGLQRLGVRPGDRVGIYLPMLPEVVAASHACALIGAVQVPIFSGFAASAVGARLQDAEAKVIITADVAMRRGKAHPMKSVVDDAVAQASSVEHVLVLERSLNGEKSQSGLIHKRDWSWSELLAGTSGDLEPQPFDSEHTYLLCYTSGTTGRPKGVVHATAGFLVKIASEVAYQTDMTREDVLHWVTDMGWLMGPWEVVGAGALGGTIVLSEGAPNSPPDRLWSLCERQRVSILGLSPTLVRGLMAHGDEPVRAHDLSALRILASTGEPWNPAPYRWLFEVVGQGRRPIVNISGGTEIGACLLSATPALPIKPCSVGMPAFGMVVDVLDANGNPADAGTVGELVCRAPWPSMTRGLWRDPERYIETYWSRFPGVWAHGDWASIDKDGYWFLYGRSDDTLNIAGKRVGPNELESILVAHPDVSEAAAVAIPHPVKGEVPWCFCVLRPGVVGDDRLAKGLASRVAVELSKSFRPDRIVFVPALPKTRSAKIVRRAVRATALGEDPGDLSTLENPEALSSIEAAVKEIGVEQ